MIVIAYGIPTDYTDKYLRIREDMQRYYSELCPDFR
jgi:hypothetical protein